MTLRSVSLTALCALLFTAGLHAGLFAKRRSVEADAFVALPAIESEIDAVELPAEIRAQLDAASSSTGGASATTLPMAPTRAADAARSLAESADAVLLPESEAAFEPLRDECEPDLHPPMRAIHRSVTRLTPPSRAVEPRLHPPHPLELAEAPGPKLVGPMMPPPPPAESSASSRYETRTAEGLPAERSSSARTSSARPLGRALKSRKSNSENAVEATGGNDRADALRRILEEELHDASPEERKVWDEEFQGLNLEVVRDLLKLRRRVNSDDELETEAAARPERIPSPAHPRRLPDAEPNLPPHPESFETARPEPGDDDGGDEGDLLRSAVMTIRAARAIHLANIANAQSPGYRRRVVTFTTSPSPASGETNRALAFNRHGPLDIVLAGRTTTKPASGVGLSTYVSNGVGGIALAAPRLDATTQGKLLVTGEPLDVAIEGPGFLEVRVGDQKRFTRCGRLTLDDQHRLGVRSGESVCPVHPEVVLPENAGAVRIGPTGQVEIQAGDSTEWTAAGRLTLARFLNPSELVPAGDVLLSARPACGAPQHGAPGAPGYGQLRSQRLEASNVDVAAELRELRRLGQTLAVVITTCTQFNLGADDWKELDRLIDELDGVGANRASQPMRDACDGGPCRAN